ncbi:MAG: TonB-dependent receptor [Flavobacteriales bacterium]|nr:TonB-dependent receptor [Flavobacteriales bacterium]
MDDSNLPIPGANIYSASDNMNGVTSDMEGKYSLSLEVGTHKIICSFISMKSDTFSVVIDAESETVHDILLESTMTQLQTMVVSAGRYEQKLEEITVSMEVIKPSLIENKNATNIKGVLDQTPGLNILDGEPQIRGGSGFNFGIGSRVAILIDGLPAMGGDGGRPEWNFIPVENVEQIEVIKGASSVTYGSSALSGSINIRTAYPKDKPETKVTIYSGIYDSPSVDSAKWWDGAANFSGASFLHSQKFGQLDFVIGGMDIFDHGFIGPSSPTSGLGSVKDTTVGENDVAEKTRRFNFNLRYRPKKLEQLNFGINGNVMQSSNNLSLIWDNDSSGIYRAFPFTVTLQKQTMLYIDPFINYFSKKGFKHSLRSRYFYTKNDVQGNPSNETDMIYTEYQLTKEIESLDGLNVTGGVIMNQVFSSAGISADSISPNKNELRNLATYAQLDKKLWGVLNASLGFRYERFELNDDTPVGKPILRSGLNWKMAKASYLRYSFGQGYRFPSITEKYIETKLVVMPVFANPDLLPESSWNTEIGFKQGFKMNKFSGSIDVAAFWQEYANTIEFTFGTWDKKVDQGGNEELIIGFKYINTGSTRVRGFEVSLVGEGEISKNFKIDILGGYTYVLPQALNPDEIFIVDSNQKGVSYNISSTDSTNNVLKYRFQHIAKVDLQLTYKMFSIGGSWRYYSHIQNIDVVFHLLEPQMNSGIIEYREEHNNGTHIVDTRVGVNVTEKLKIGFVVNNTANLSYALRPLKIESPRTFAVQISLKT